MNPAFLGDSYDFVKRTIIHGLAPSTEEWAVHPMYFSQPRKNIFVQENFVHQYTEFLGIGLVDGHNYVRENVGEIGALCPSHLFLDPDTGLRIHGGPGPQHLDVPELAAIANAPVRKHKLTLVYDQSYSRQLRLEGRMEKAQGKLGALRDHDIYGAAYVSHLVFIWVSADQDTVIAATNRLIACSRLPRWRFVGHGV